MKKTLKIFGLIVLGLVIYVYIGETFLTPRQENLSTPSNSTVVTEPESEPITTDNLFIEINKVRAANSLPQFKRNVILEKSALLKCQDMAGNSYYGHDNPSTGKKGYSYIEDAGIKFGYASENLNQGYFLSAKHVVDSWMSSESHAASIVDPRYTEIGFATCVDSKNPNQLLVVQHKIEVSTEQQVQYVPQSQPRYDYSRNLYDSPTTTRCTHNSYGGGATYSQATTTCVTN